MKDKRQMVGLKKYEALKTAYERNLQSLYGMEKQLLMAMEDRDRYRDRAQALERELEACIGKLEQELQACREKEAKCRKWWHIFRRH